MGTSLNIALTDELRSFIDQNSGDGTFYATPTEYVRSLIREEKQRQEAAMLRSGIIEGYLDLGERACQKYRFGVFLKVKKELKPLLLT